MFLLELSIFFNLNICNLTHSHIGHIVFFKFKNYVFYVAICFFTSSQKTDKPLLFYTFP